MPFPLPGLLVAFSALVVSLPARAADVDLSGRWKLVILSQLIESDLLIVDVTNHAGTLQGAVLDSQPLPVKPSITRIGSKEGSVDLSIKIGEIAAEFRGRPTGPNAIAGTLKVGSQLLPARLEKTTDRKVPPEPTQPPEVFRDYLSARNEQRPRTRVRLLRALLKQKPGNPSFSAIYVNVLSDAEAAELPEADVRALVAEWVDGAKPHGDDFAAGIRTQAALALAGKPMYANLALDLAREADAALNAEAPLQTRAEVAAALANAAKLAGTADLAASARARADRFEAELDAEYHKKVPPFQPDASLGRADRPTDRVVLLELFTGAECPPCVAADVAFDALTATAKPTQLVTLQYHLHIPGPDPLTSPDALSRADYYPDFRGTPAPYFDGKAEASGGGGMAASQGKYRDYLEVISRDRDKAPRATITLKADRKAETILIRAEAETKVPGSKLKLRLALVENEIRYVGGNGLRFHHHVVRGMPGGVGGQAFTDNRCKIETVVDLADLRKILEKSLADSIKEGNTFRKALPPIPLTRLSVVAFVQDDADRSVLNAAIVPADRTD